MIFSKIKGKVSSHVDKKCGKYTKGHLGPAHLRCVGTEDRGHRHTHQSPLKARSPLPEDLAFRSVRPEAPPFRGLHPHLLGQVREAPRSSARRFVLVPKGHAFGWAFAARNSVATCLR